MVEKDNEQEHNQSKEDREDHLLLADRQDIPKKIAEDINIKTSCQACQKNAESNPQRRHDSDRCITV